MRFYNPPHENDKVFNFEFDKHIEIPKNLEFQPYQPGLREGVDICVLFNENTEEQTGADLAFLRYQPGAYVPGHVHIGYETVLVLQGQYIENGVEYRSGAFIVRSPGTCHSMASGEGCLILASRYKPVQQITS